MPIPNEQAFQVFYGTIPFILVVVGGFLRGQMLLKDILARLSRVEAGLDEAKGEFRKGLSEVKERLVVLETRAGIVYRG